MLIDVYVNQYIYVGWYLRYQPQYIFVHDCIKCEILRNKTREEEGNFEFTMFLKKISQRFAAHLHSHSNFMMHSFSMSMLTILSRLLIFSDQPLVDQSESLSSNISFQWSTSTSPSRPSRSTSTRPSPPARHENVSTSSTRSLVFFVGDPGRSKIQEGGSSINFSSGKPCNVERSRAFIPLHRFQVSVVFSRLYFVPLPPNGVSPESFPIHFSSCSNPHREFSCLKTTTMYSNQRYFIVILLILEFLRRSFRFFFWRRKWSSHYIAVSRQWWFYNIIYFIQSFATLQNLFRSRVP